MIVLVYKQIRRMLLVGGGARGEIVMLVLETFRKATAITQSDVKYYNLGGWEYSLLMRVQGKVGPFH